VHLFLSVFLNLRARWLLFFTCAPLSRGDANKLKLISLFFKCALLSNRDVHELKFIRHFFLVCSSIHGDANECGLFFFLIAPLSKGDTNEL
jgi:hypothetical protein